MEELEELKEIKKRLENKIENFFDGEIYSGDQGYQELLCYLEEIEEEIERIENEN